MNETLVKILFASKYKIGEIQYEPTTTERAFMLFIYDQIQQAEYGTPFIMPQKEIASNISTDYRTVGKIMRRLVEFGVLVGAQPEKGWEFFAINAFSVEHKGEDYEVSGITLCDYEVINEKLNPPEVPSYYVYMCSLDNKPVYIGMGKGDRINHCLSGCSSSAKLNELVFTHGKENFKVEKLFEGLTREAAADKERTLIQFVRYSDPDQLKNTV